MRDHLWTLKECAEFLRVKPDWVYRAIKHRNLPYIKVGRLYRFDPEDIEKWLKENKH